MQQDANWNVTALVDGTGAVVERYAYDPYGVQTVYNVSWSSIGSSAYSWSSGFQGFFFDSIAGMNEADWRWYSPTLQRWVTMDPDRYPAGDVNLYRFVGNNPTYGTDPTGLWRFGAEVDIDLLRFASHIPAVQRVLPRMPRLGGPGAGPPTILLNLKFGYGSDGVHVGGGLGVGQLHGLSQPSGISGAISY